MRMTPHDVENQKFNRAFRGYNEEEVDHFLEKLSEDYAGFYREHHDLQQKLAAMEAQLEEYRRLKEAVEKSVVLAQKTADEVVRQAETRARAVVGEAEETKEKSRLDLLQMESRKAQFVEEFRLMLQTHLNLLESSGYRKLAAS